MDGQFIHGSVAKISPPPPQLNACDCPVPNNRRHPAGCIRVEFDFNIVPVEIVRVLVKDSWFTGDITYTDASGCWEVNSDYSGRVWMWVKFGNENVKVRDLGFWGSFFIVNDYRGRFNGPPYNNVNIEYESAVANNDSKERIYWAAAHTLNSVNQYRNLAQANGIPLPRTGLNWTNARGDAAAAAPMLQGNVFNSWIALLVVWRAPIHYIASLALLPDVINRYEDGEGAAEFTGTAFHELGHASHYSLVGEGYWVDYRNHIINNVGYGEFGKFANNSNPGVVALGEAVGSYIGARYGGTNGGGEGSDFEDNFIPEGLLWDLEDIEDDRVTDPNDNRLTIMENISGFTPNMMFNALTPNVESIRQYRDRLRILHLDDTPNDALDFDNVVDVYDVFN